MIQGKQSLEAFILKSKEKKVSETKGTFLSVPENVSGNGKVEVNIAAMPHT